MKTTIHGLHTTVTPALEEHVYHCASKLDKYDPDAALALDVTLTVEGKDKFDVSVKVRGQSISGECLSDDMYASITVAFENVETMLARRKGKKLSKRKDKIEFTDAEE